MAARTRSIAFTLVVCGPATACYAGISATDDAGSESGTAAATANPSTSLDATAITGGSADGAQVILELSGDASLATGVSYLGHQGPGPWVTNENGVGLLAFSNLPLQ